MPKLPPEDEMREYINAYLKKYSVTALYATVWENDNDKGWEFEWHMSLEDANEDLKALIEDSDIKGETALISLSDVFSADTERARQAGWDVEGDKPIPEVVRTIYGREEGDRMIAAWETAMEIHRIDEILKEKN